MDRQGIKAFLKQFGGLGLTTADTGEWVNTQCLFPWKHERGQDRMPSAGISVHPDGVSFYNCYACKSKGSLASVLRQLGHYRKIDYREHIKLLEIGEEFNLTPGEWGEKEEKELPPEPLDARVHLGLYDTCYDHPYVLARSVSAATAEKIQLRYDPADSRGEPRILFPVFSRDNQFYGYSGRAVNPGVEPKARNYFGLKKKWLLLGVHLIAKKPQHIILVEGLFAYARFVENKQPVVASLGAELSEEQANILIDIGSPVYCFYDPDKAGIDGQKSVKKRLAKYLPVLKVRMPHDVNDVDNLTRAEIADMILDARLM